MLCTNRLFISDYLWSAIHSSFDHCCYWEIFILAVWLWWIFYRLNDKLFGLSSRCLGMLGKIEECLYSLKATIFHWQMLSWKNKAKNKLFCHKDFQIHCNFFEWDILSKALPSFCSNIGSFNVKFLNMSFRSEKSFK